MSPSLTAAGKLPPLVLLITVVLLLSLVSFLTAPATLFCAPSASSALTSLATSLELTASPESKGLKLDQALLRGSGGEELARRLVEGELLWRKSVRLREDFYLSKGGISNVALLGEGGGTYTVWDIFTPAFPCPLLAERVGRLGDGGKWVCGLAQTLSPSSSSLSDSSPRVDNKKVGMNGGPVVYSIGVERESSFEAELLERFPNITIYGYDLSVDDWGPQIQSNPDFYERAFFRKFGLASKDESEMIPPMHTLKTMMQMNGHDWIDIFKIDIEGSEWSVLKSIIDDFPTELPFGQMQIEIHVNGPNKTIAEVDTWWRALENAGLRAFHHELNMPTAPAGGIYYSEYSFINVYSTKSPLLGIGR